MRHETLTAACSSLRTAGTPEPAKFVPATVVEEMKGQVATLTSQHLAREIDDLVKPALADGRLLPAQEPWARDLGKTSVAALTGYLSTAQPIAALTSTQTQGQAPALATGNAKLSAGELAVCTAMGRSPDQYKAGAAA